MVSDPDNPVPYYNNVTTRGRDRAYMAGDQRFASKRGDVLTFSWPATRATLRMMGPVKVNLVLNTDATDLLAVVKIIDVRPDGYEMLVRGDVMPARFRHSFSKPKPITPNKDFNISFTMPDIAHVLMPGHKLMVQVQFSWFPLVAVNPQTYMKNPYKATASDYRKATVALQGNGKSFVELSVW